MSKTALKKELQRMSYEQLTEILLNLYTARKEVKEYFEFFLNPDCDKLLTRYAEAINKEMGRGKRGMARFRISVVRRLIKDFEGFDPGAEYVLRLMVFALGRMMFMSIPFYYTKTQENAVVTMACDIVDYGDKHQLFAQALEAVSSIVDNERGSAVYLRRMVKAALEEKGRQ